LDKPHLTNTFTWFVCAENDDAVVRVDMSAVELKWITFGPSQQNAEI